MRTRAIIIKKQATNEYDQQVTCYTEEFGKIVAVAKSVLKPSSIQAMHLDMFNLVDFELVSGKGMPIITGAQAEKIYPGLKNNLSSLAVAYFFAETAERLFFEYQRDDDLWEFFDSLLMELDRGISGNKKFLKDRQMELLDILGYRPNMAECAFCSSRISEKLAAYSTELKGGICRDCFLGGVRATVVKSGDLFTEVILGSIFEGLAERNLSSLNFLKYVVK